MPWIPRIEKKKRDYSIDLLNEKRAFAAKLYASSGWKILRMERLVEHPTCERCENLGILTLACEVHHVIKFLSAKSEEEKIELFYKYSNLMSTCKPCHKIMDNTA